ncbi:hypothetical protein EZI54_21895 [Marinobacter halodurans]|uniref:Sulfatase-modifying factor enzyme-like domain-containing protein n=1 Tax=Marinobacter halodurans TaxID=2528979 RepID=A0ABY1ZE35_9GAMM|nr:SUMF1/EgtB/PvdO family nonheme iron enzyme [Marinobacter halodurans]TBW47984.1 hypothetical protein EZI54_21895 [Marinobacter halodurans]
MRIKLFRSLPFFALLTATTGCSYYYESKADDMVQRQMDAMVFVKGGEFMMGNPGGWSVRHDTIPTHKVILNDFYIQKYEVTQGDFELFQAVTGYEHSDKYYDDERDEKPDRYKPELPAVASWKDASAFCRWLGEQSGKAVQLPTEAQWEFAARARGQMLRYATEDGEAEPNVTMAAGPERFTRDTSKRDSKLPVKPGSYPANPIGLYDMSGNVGEWVQDKYKEDYYKNSPAQNPQGPDEGQKDAFFGENYRVLRGGSYLDFIGNTTVTRRKGAESLSSEIRGFRCAY